MPVCARAGSSKGRTRLGLLEEPLLGRLVAGQIRREELDGDLALQALVLGGVDDPHAAVAEFGADRIRAKGGAWAEGHGRTGLYRLAAFRHPGDPGEWSGVSQISQKHFYLGHPLRPTTSPNPQHHEAKVDVI